MPSWTEVPDLFEVNFLERASEPGIIFSSKAVGEPLLVLAIYVREAIRDAIAGFGGGDPVSLDTLAMPERAIERAEREPYVNPVGASGPDATFLKEAPAQ